MAKIFQTAHGDFPVSPAMETHLAAFAGTGELLTQAGATNVRERMIALADTRARQNVEPTLTPDERAVLQGADRVFDLHTQATFLDGKALADYGFDFLDELHGMKHTHPCGCVSLSVFHHYKPGSEAQPHKVAKACEAHLAHASDPKAHRHAITVDAAKGR